MELFQADLCIQNVRVYNSYFKDFEDADLYIKNEKIYYIDVKKSWGVLQQGGCGWSWSICCSWVGGHSYAY